LAAKARWEVPVVVGAHSCVLSWWNAVKREAIPPWLIRYREEVAAGLAAADAVVAPTRAMLDDLEKIYEVDFGGLVICNGIDPSPFSNDNNKLPRVLSAGRAWDEAKNIQLLDVIAEDVAWPILVAGDTVPPLAGKTRSFANLQLLGQLSASALRQEMRRAAIYAAPAWYEPFGLAVLEAALSGCTLVLADIPSFHELWHDAALLVDLGKPDLWKTTVNALIDDPQMQSVLSKRARQRALTLSRTAMSASYYALYRHLAKLQDVEMQSAT
jgi:glycosyltransferase involved in cell wall biosynthesis